MIRGSAAATSPRGSGPHRPPRTQGPRGQSLVELALVLPMLIVLLLGAVDFGRLFFGWVAVNNASRIGANYAATHPDAWALGNTGQQDEYEALIQHAGATNCDITINDPVFPDGTRDLGDRVRVDLDCEFQLIFPLMQGIFGDPVDVAASSTFNVRRGCVDCAAVPAGSPPPATNHCRPIPDIVGLSVDGARLKWTAAGFTGPFLPTTAEGWRTVATKTVDQGGVGGCDGIAFAFFESSVTVTLAPIVEPAAGETCRTVPNVTGMTVTDGRSAWQTAGFDPGLFTPSSGSDDQIISTATYTPSDAAPGQCREPDLAVEVQHVAPPPPPPAPPCKVPSFVNTQRSAAQTTWTDAGFTTTVQYQPPPQNWTVIKSQSLVGGSYAACSSSITVTK